MKWFNLSDSVNSLALLGALAILLISAFVIGGYYKKMKDSKASVESTGEEWDGIGELKNNLPTGWAISFIAVMVWALWYFFLGYPLNSYSQIGEYNEEVKAHNAKFEQNFAGADKATLKNMGESVFLVQCAQCHGVSGDGINGVAQNLTKWGSEAGLEDTIINGSEGMEYPLGMMSKAADLGIDNNTAKAIAAYVAKEVSAIKSTKNENLVSQGREAFGVCASCHGEDGKGMDGSAPDLTKYGSSEFVKEVLNRGKAGSIGVMPSFTDGRLSEVQKQAVGEFISSLAE
ncbi:MULTISPECIES: cbb3-type cytochrome c oxidase N-terminal domain-containing protein [unclassified Campylobacter]|uniref:cbb3-type cytochrome c oxidase N-terminal domain-containing protein n=1 Tax=unclassified Campylobacter TaxID=2593542 RepID=UPI0022E9F4FF|nr:MULTISPECIES: cbb3-type cytochrome c oxidase N-terminal domain-containing protein [unclassified Campylobacter]MDA3056080.1 c-type cytochrome [Campylobacter sp. CN_NA1]MDA3065225.1 c-type cytochrome [Campylobacter sp. CN_NE4]MDA3068050.1 c-type cytochrome [Campylobacter sp. CN_NE3]MDA3082678.1 c-type cytochrome [Campylobacter sp. CN_EL2]MDA3083583.1 c-type cytochrome [Campylobacter sp. CN_NE1]